MNDGWETILEAAGEGGCIKLLGRKDKYGEWSYKTEVRGLYYDDVYGEAPDINQPVKSVSQERIITNWQDALRLINCYPLAGLLPVKVHGEFADKIFKEVIKDDDLQYVPERWIKACYPEGSEIALLAYYIKKSRFTVILTGAGMSTESGIPDFRSKDGWWKQINPTAVATIDALKNNYDLFYEFYKMRINAVDSCEPHDGHKILAEWEAKGLIQSIATQNVDGFHQKAGSKKVYELHGSINKIRCSECHVPDNKNNFILKNPCAKCGGRLRPGVVLFGEDLPQSEWNKALNDIMKAELLIVIGSSLKVSPVNILPSITKGKVAYINDEIDQNSSFDLIIKGKAKNIILKLNEILE